MVCRLFRSVLRIVECKAGSNIYGDLQKMDALIRFLHAAGHSRRFSASGGGEHEQKSMKIA